jgi:hypothetical protein
MGEWFHNLTRYLNFVNSVLIETLSVEIYRSTSLESWTRGWLRKKDATNTSAVSLKDLTKSY